MGPLRGGTKKEFAWLILPEFNQLGEGRAQTGKPYRFLVEGASAVNKAVKGKKTL